MKKNYLKILFSKRFINLMNDIHEFYAHETICEQHDGELSPRLIRRGFGCRNSIVCISISTLDGIKLNIFSLTKQWHMRSIEPAFKHLIHLHFFFFCVSSQNGTWGRTTNWGWQIQEALLHGIRSILLLFGCFSLKVEAIDIRLYVKWSQSVLRNKFQWL